MPKSCLSLALGVVCAITLPAQTSRGTVSGLVTDPSSAVIPAASIELKNQQTGVARSTESNEAGLYRFDAVDLGIYDVTVKSTGFKVFLQRAVHVQAGMSATVDARLEVGEAATTVEVTTGGVTIQTEAPVRGGNIGSTQITELPIAYRN